MRSNMNCLFRPSPEPSLDRLTFPNSYIHCEANDQTRFSASDGFEAEAETQIVRPFSSLRPFLINLALQRTV